MWEDIVKVLGIAAIVAVGVIAGIMVYKVKGKIDRDRLKEIAIQQVMERVIVQKVDLCENRVKFKDLISNKAVEVRGDDIDDSLYEGEIITVS
jgi:hypothetical protein